MEKVKNDIIVDEVDTELSDDDVEDEISDLDELLEEDDAEEEISDSDELLEEDDVEKEISTSNDLLEDDSFDNASLESLAQYAEEAGIDMKEEETVLAEDLDGFAKGFPNWDLLPPKKQNNK